MCSTQVHHSCLPAPSSGLSLPFNTLPALQHISNLHAILATCTLLLPSTTTFHLLVSLNVLTTTTLLHLSGFFQSFTSHSPMQYGNLGACAKSSDPRGFQRLYNQPKNSPSNAREISLSLGAL
ncbi:hypothetical protein M405DRAFT_870121 [Rhizopogon salebrosus TDB-379]|nr:hypothetical protein M405DRAFT_870121 [Rhizopogon salebrosus TDB-379]